mmetsp:Transcript_18447/g.57791  ORF Transcript_18447/g.57791 Transcript_18447/m.57791 type:complete len:202 (-) Transcript_18447:282-887(-)
MARAQAVHHMTPRSQSESQRSVRGAVRRERPLLTRWASPRGSACAVPACGSSPAFAEVANSHCRSSCTPESSNAKSNERAWLATEMSKSRLKGVPIKSRRSSPRTAEQELESSITALTVCTLSWNLEGNVNEKAKAGTAIREAKAAATVNCAACCTTKLLPKRVSSTVARPQAAPETSTPRQPQHGSSDRRPTRATKGSRA